MWSNMTKAYKKLYWHKLGYTYSEYWGSKGHKLTNNKKKQQKTTFKLLKEYSKRLPK